MKYVLLIGLALGLVLSGCTPPSLLEEESPYAKAIKEAETKARVERINNRSRVQAAQEEVVILSAEAEADLLRLSIEKNVKITDDTDVKRANYKIVDMLVKAAGKELPKNQPVLVASFVNLDNLRDSCSFGRMVGEQMATRFSQLGYTVIEMKLRTQVFIKEGSGELLLSRELREISKKHHAVGAVVGTYVVGADKVYLTARVVDTGDGKVLASRDYELPIGLNTFKMLLK